MLIIVSDIKTFRNFWRIIASSVINFFFFLVLTYLICRISNKTQTNPKYNQLRKRQSFRNHAKKFDQGSLATVRGLSDE